MVKLTEINTNHDMALSDYVFKNNPWYLYLGGRKSFQKELQRRRVAQLNLIETREIVQAWKIHNFFADPKTLVLLEQAVWLTLCIEWNDLAKIFFNYDKNQVICSGFGMEVVI